MVFSERMPPDPQAPWRTDIALRESSEWRHYMARWQPGAYALTEIPDPRSPETNPADGLVAVRIGQRCWFRFGDGSDTGRLDYGEGAENPVCTSGFSNSGVLFQVLSLGLMHVDPGTVVWEGSRFDVPKPNGGMGVSGRIQEVGPDGRVESLLVSYTNRRGDVHWRIRYRYEPALPRGGGGRLPAFIDCYWLNGETEVHRSEFVLHRIDVSDAALGLDAYDPDPVASRLGWQVLVFTDRAIHLRSPDGTLAWISDLRDGVSSKRGPYPPGRIDYGVAYGTWGAFNLGFFILLYRMNRRNTPTRKEMRNE